MGAFVDETALRVGISAVRKALGNDGDRYIATVAGRGYCFVHDVETTTGKPAPESADHAIAFGPFRLFAMQHLLLEAKEPVRLGPRALEILITLVERCGDVVSREELIARAWPNTFVEDANLKVHVSSLRRALGDGVAGNRYIIHIPRLQFVASVTRSETPSSIGRPPSIGHSHQLPAPLTRMIGRGATVDTISAQLPQSRLLTIVGPGGIGKTSVALAGVQKTARIVSRRSQVRRSGPDQRSTACAERTRSDA